MAFAGGCGGGGGGGSSGDFKPRPDLRIDAVSPEVGTANGGTLVTITGDGFVGVQEVWFGETRAALREVDEPSTIRCQTAASTEYGVAVDVKVVTSQGSCELRGSFMYLYGDVIESLEWTFVGQTTDTQGRPAGRFDFQWDLSGAGDAIDVYRGAVFVASLDGDARSFTTLETFVHAMSSGEDLRNMGIYRYTFVLRPYGNATSTIVDVGRLVWDPPPELVEGYLVYAASTEAGLSSPGIRSFAAGLRRQVRLRELYDAGSIRRSGQVWLAAACYNRAYVSELSDAVTCYYTVVMESP